MSAANAPRPAAAPDRATGVAARRRGERLVALLAAGAVALNYPLISVFSDVELLAGVPVLYLYLFAVWAGLIGATALVLRRGRPAPPGRRAGPGP